MYSSKENINILTALLVDYGIEHIVVCPGSRNAPLVHNFNEHPDLTIHPVTDERSAAFVALGISHQTGTIVAVCVTSGSALLNTLPGVAEASYQHKGIVVISADRPAEWIGQLDGQTMPQPGAMSTFVAKTVSLPQEGDWHIRRLVCEAMITRLTTGQSVHINVPISEPLFLFNVERLPELQAVYPLRWDDDIERKYLLDLLSEAERPMIVIGQCNRYEATNEAVNMLKQGFVVLSEPLSTDDPSPSLDDVFRRLDSCDFCIAKADLIPDFIIYFGSTTISKRLRQFLRTLDDTTVVMVNPNGELEDITQHAQYVVQGSTSRVLEQLPTMLKMEKNAFGMAWDELLSTTRKMTEAQPTTLCEQAVHEFERHMQKNDVIFYANSSAIRYAARYANHFVFCNRGLNGIEGSLSTAVGAALVCDEQPIYCVIGDLSFFYDQNALWNTYLPTNLRILLLNNGGGGIFTKLPGLEASPARDEYIMASHHTTAVGACHQYGISRKAVSKTEDLSKAIEWLMENDTNCARLVEVMEVND